MPHSTTSDTRVEKFIELVMERPDMFDASRKDNKDVILENISDSIANDWWHFFSASVNCRRDFVLLTQNFLMDKWFHIHV